MQAIILAGGLGRRLHSVVSDVPKPMAPIHGKPFLAYLIEYLKAEGITNIILSLCYLPQKIQNYFQNEYAGIPIEYVIETSPLGTGGALQNIFHTLGSMQDPVFVLNGDTFVKVDYKAMRASHISFSMALRPIEDCARYGSAVVQNGNVVDFIEKGTSGPGLINAGVYLMSPKIFSKYNLPQSFSLETDFLTPNVKKIQPKAFIAHDYFIDIGIPEDYFRAQCELVS